MKSLPLFAFFATLLAAASAPTPPSLRLGHEVVPKHIALDLTLSPEKSGFSGHVRMDLIVAEPVDHFWLNATGLIVSNARVEQNGKTVAARLIPGGTDFVGFELPEPLAAGPARLTLDYTGEVNLRSSAGIFRSKSKSDLYLYTQFEPIDARRAFPCFDEPAFKIPWQLTLHIPAGDTAVSNTNIESKQPEAGGMETVRFAETKPLPSYLIAFGVGPFDYVDAGTAGSRHVPVRIVVPRGDAARAKYAASVSANILTRLENYFGIPYPYPKADQLAVPLSFGGAMENPGLVTYDSNIILSPPGEDTVQHQREYASVAAHELAHQWVGDLVTMAWWNDTWLNESFATWMSSKILAAWHPEWESRARDQDSTRLRAIEMDTETSARRINQPVESKSDIANAFDGITYLKGGSVLRMFEQYVGPDSFRRGVHAYLLAHEFGNARTEDFLAALGAESKPEVAAAFRTFLDQNGVPVVKATLECSGGKPAKLALEQQRLLPVGSSGSIDRTWEVPFCTAYSHGHGRIEQCDLLTQQSGSMTLKGAGCPVWFLGNDEEAGYYQVRYDVAALATLLDHRGQLSLSEQVGLLGDLHSLARTGLTPRDQILALAPKLATDPHPQILNAAMDLAEIPDVYIPADLRPNYARFIQSVFGQRAEAIGWLAKPGDSADIKLLRARLLNLVANSGDDPALVSAATALTGKWLDDRSGLPPNILSAVLSTAARHGDAALFAKIQAAAEAETDPYFKPILVRALGDFRNRELAERGMSLLLSGVFDARISLRLLTGPASNPGMEDMPYEFVKAHYDQLAAKLPSGAGRDYASFLPRLAAMAGCSDAAAGEAEAFFKPRMAEVQGGARNLAQSVEGIRLCAAAKPAAETQVARFLKAY